MLQNLKALMVILPIAMVVFALAKPICLKFMAEEDFKRRRNIWFALTLSAFVLPSYWAFVLVALILVARGARKDTNPVALYVLVLLVISPLVSPEIPVVGIKALFRLNFPRLLALAILVPLAWRLVRSRERNDALKPTLMDGLILAYAVLVVLLITPYETTTTTVRRTFLISIDILVLYFVVSRACASRRAIVEVMASGCLACALLAPMAVVETVSAWLLHASVGENWSIPSVVGFETRAGLLRAQLSAGHSTALGNLFAIGFGFSLYFWSRLPSTSARLIIPIWMWVGLIVASSRGPWIAALMLLFVFLALSPNGAARVFMASVFSALAGGLVLVSPIGQDVIDYLPFIGKIGAENVDYRQLLIAVAWEQIQRYPFFGNPLVMLDLEILRQGEGIIDLLNAYLTIAMYYGCVTLTFYVGFLLVGIWRARRLVKLSAEHDADLSLLGASLVACMFALLLMLAVGGVGPGTEKMLYVVVGLIAAYAQLGSLQEAMQAQQRRGGRSPMAP